MSLRLSRVPIIPDLVRVARYQRAPELGPRLLFFSGGTALREVSQILTDYTHNSFHLITPFVAGGNSATLRRAFGMISVGDFRQPPSERDFPDRPHRLIITLLRCHTGHAVTITSYSMREGALPFPERRGDVLPVAADGTKGNGAILRGQQLSRVASRVSLRGMLGSAHLLLTRRGESRRRSRRVG